MPIIPNPTEARELRGQFADHPVIALALMWLAAADITHVWDVMEELPRWEFYSQLSEREVAATLAAFVPPPADVCRRCRRSIRYVTDGPDPGWWTHTDVDALAVVGQHHPAMPDHGGKVGR